MESVISVLEEVVKEVVENSANKPKLPSLTEFMQILDKCVDHWSYLSKFQANLPEKARPYRVRYLQITNMHDDGIFIKFKFEDNENNEKWDLIKVEKHLIGNIFALIRFFHPEKLCLYMVDVVGFIINHLPAWWKSGITMLDLLTRVNLWIDDGDAHADVVPAIETFPDLHSFGTNRSKIRLTEVLQLFKTIRHFFYIGMEATDQDLDLICTKSNNMDHFILLSTFTADSVINFVKNGNFAERVRIEFEGIIGPANLLQFVKTTKNFTFTNFTCSFEYKESSFQIFWYEVKNISNTDADYNGAPRAG